MRFRNIDFPNDEVEAALDSSFSDLLPPEGTYRSAGRQRGGSAPYTRHCFIGFVAPALIHVARMASSDNIHLNIPSPKYKTQAISPF